MKKDNALDNILIIAVVNTIISISCVVINVCLDNNFNGYFKHVGVITTLIGLAAAIAWLLAHNATSKNNY